VRPEQFDSPFAPGQERVDEISIGIDELTAAITPATVVPLDAIVNPEVGADPDIRDVLLLGLDLRRDDGWERLANVYAATPELLAALAIDPGTLPDGIATSRTGGEIYVGPTAPGPPLADTARESVAGTGTLPETYTSLPAALLDPALAAARGWEVVPSGRWLLEFDGPLDDAQIEVAQGIAARHGFVIETREEDSRLGEVRLASGLVGMTVALAVLAATVGLIRGESSGELRTLTATGATRSVRRAITAVTAGTLAALGATLGIAAAYIGLLAGGVDHLAPLPWRDLALVAIGTPAIAALAGWLIAGREPSAIARRPLD
jgi:putative ABC transport system permease protein